MKNEKVVSIFWTGGYDSTFRVVMLSRCDVTIQPIYMSDKKDRTGEEFELKAIEEITGLLIKHPETKAKIRPLIYVSMDERHENEDYRDAYSRILQKDFVGSQYVWLGAFSEKNPNIEMSIHKDDKAINIILKYGKLKKVSDEIIGDYYVIDKESTPKDIVKLWGNLHFPLVYITKIEMRDFFKNNGYSDIANKTWFCHTPKNGKPCGTCNPCKYTIEEGLIERFSTIAIIRYYRKKIINHCKWRLNKIWNSIFKKR